MVRRWLYLEVKIKVLSALSSLRVCLASALWRCASHGSPEIKPAFVSVGKNVVFFLR
jgi:hypothetical protein